MLQPSLEHTTSFDVDAPPTSSTGTLRSGASLLERMKGLFSMASGNGHPPDPGLGNQKAAAGAHSMSAGASNRREDISLEQRPSGDDHVHMAVDMLGEAHAVSNCSACSCLHVHKIEISVGCILSCT